MTLTLHEQHFESFFELPFQIYGNRYPFVSPLKGDLKAMLEFEKNPFFGGKHGTYYTASRDGVPVGRICAHVHPRAQERFGKQEGSFGFMDCIDDPQVAQVLLEAAETFVRAQGCTRIRGNMNLTANQEIGILTKGEENPPFLAQIYNPEYLPKLLEGAGYQAVYPMKTWINDRVQDFDADAMLGEKQRAILQDRRYEFRALNPRQFEQEVEHVRQVLNGSMEHNHLFVPMTEAEAQFQLGPLKLVMDPNLLQLAFFEGQPVGVTLCVPDLVPLLHKMRSRLAPWGWWHFLTGRKQIRSASIIIILTLPAHQSRGVTRVLFHLLMKALQQGAYTRVGGTWISDDNVASLRSAQAIGMRPYHHLSLFEKELS